MSGKTKSPDQRPVTPQEAASAVKQVAKQAVKVSASAAQLEASAGAVERSADLQTETAIRRTVLAADRTVLAAERTYAAWLRTGLGALAAGVGAHALFENNLPNWLVALVASILVVFAGACFVVAAWRQVRLSTMNPPASLAPLPSAVSVGLSALLTAVAVVALIEIVVSARA